MIIWNWLIELNWDQEDDAYMFLWDAPRAQLDFQTWSECPNEECWMICEGAVTHCTECGSRMEITHE